MMKGCRWRMTGGLLFLLMTVSISGCNRPLPPDALMLLADLFRLSGEVTALTVTPGSPAMVPDTNLQFQAVGTTRQGGSTDVTSAVTWNSSNESIATISNESGSNGLVRAVAAGTITISATLNAISSEASGGSAQLLVTTSTKILFVSANSVKGDFGNTATADGTCNTDLPSSKALLVDGSTRVACTTANCGGGPSEHTDWVLAANQPYFRADGTTHVFTTDANGIFVFGSATNPIVDGGSKFWSGLNTDWTTSSDRCANWTDIDPFNNGAVGNSAQSGSSLINANSQGCNASLPLACVEQ